MYTKPIYSGKNDTKSKGKNILCCLMMIDTHE